MTTDTVTENVVSAPIEIEAQGNEEPSPSTLIDGPKKGRQKKNHTDSKINPNRYESINEFLEEFYGQCATHKPRKGYDQHWNSEGFIHSGPAIRLPNRGAANMMVLLIDVLSDRIINSSNADVSQDAEAFYNIVLEFMQKRIAERKAEYERDILAAAAKIEASKS